jgi:hypothetical protein
MMKVWSDCNRERIEREKREKRECVHDHMQEGFKGVDKIMSRVDMMS